MEAASNGRKLGQFRLVPGHFRDLPIQRKMLVVTLLICGAVLCVAIAALFTFHAMNFRANFQRDAATLARIIANNSTGALSFNDDKTGAEVVGALQAKPTVVGANLVVANGSPFAHFGVVETEETLAQFPRFGEQRFVGGHLLIAQPVTLKQERIGTLYMRLDYHRTFLQLLGLYGSVVPVVALGSIGLAWFLSGRLGRRITDPILQLARTAQVVGERKDYSMRARVDGGADEVGRLTESFNDMLGRIQSQDAALSFSQQKMEALINSIDGIVWECGPDRARFTFVSRQSEDVLGYSPEAWLGTPGFWEQRLQADDAERAVETGQDLAARREPYRYEYRMVAADGRTVWIRESGTVLVENSQPIALRGIFQDITRQKSDADQLDKLNRQLMETSRQAGMAEVATGVLHNVGNVLNSVSVSATIVTERLRRLKVDNLRQATAMLREQNGRLPEFLMSDPKGKILPAYLGTLADQLSGQQTRLIAQMDSVGQHIEHIKEIVAMQQTYAKVSGVYENLSVTGLVEDALRMNAAAFDRHHIDLVKEFDRNVPPVCVDRHHQRQWRRDCSGEPHADIQSRFYHQEGWARLRPAQRRQRGKRNGGHTDRPQRRSR
jgi:PAS domain S-box-containing protein